MNNTDVKEDISVYPWQQSSLEQLASAAAGDRLGHGWLIHGPPGLGVVRLCRVLAAALSDGLPPTDWGRRIPATAGAEPVEVAARPDVQVLAPDGTRRTIGVDQVRAMSADLAMTSHGGGARAVVIDRADQLTVAAANSLLKTLEEPPAGAHLLLASHEPGRLPATVRSRCQRLTVRRPPNADAQAWLARSDGQRDWTLALALADGCPLRALALAAAGVDTADPARCDALAAVLAGRSGADALVAEPLRSDAAEFLEWLQGRLEAVLEARAGDTQPPGDHDAFRALCHSVAGVSDQALFRLRDRVLGLRRLTDGGVNLALSLEALLNSWNRSSRSGANLAT